MTTGPGTWLCPPCMYAPAVMLLATPASAASCLTIPTCSLLYTVDEHQDSCSGPITNSHPQPIITAHPCHQHHVPAQAMVLALLVMAFEISLLYSVFSLSCPLLYVGHPSTGGPPLSKPQYQVLAGPWRYLARRVNMHLGLGPQWELLFYSFISDRCLKARGGPCKILQCGLGRSR